MGSNRVWSVPLGSLEWPQVSPPQPCHCLTQNRASLQPGPEALSGACWACHLQQALLAGPFMTQGLAGWRGRRERWARDGGRGTSPGWASLAWPPPLSRAVPSRWGPPRGIIWAQLLHTVGDGYPPAAGPHFKVSSIIHGDLEELLPAQSNPVATLCRGCLSSSGCAPEGPCVFSSRMGGPLGEARAPRPYTVPDPMGGPSLGPFPSSERLHRARGPKPGAKILPAVRVWPGSLG